MPKIAIEGNASIAINQFIAICAHCNHHEIENATIELNFREKKMIFLCDKCKKMNEIKFGNTGPPPPLPRTRM